MPDYRRAWVPGGTFFFTVVTYGRRPILTGEAARVALRHAMARTRHDHPFELDAIVILPDHLHAIWTLPVGDADFSTRWRLIKARFTRGWLPSDEARGGGISSRPTFVRASRGERDVWQPRFWEHAIRDEGDLERHLDYVHYNPVKHGLAGCPHGWAWSSFGRLAGESVYRADWRCGCGGRRCDAPDFGWAEGLEME